MPSHCLNRCLNIVNWTLRKITVKSKSKFIYFHSQNAFQSIVLNMAAIMSRSQYVKPSHPRYIIHYQTEIPCSVWSYLLVSGVPLASSIPVAISAPLTGRKMAGKITGWAWITCFTCEDVGGRYPIPIYSVIVQSWANLTTFVIAPFSAMMMGEVGMYPPSVQCHKNVLMYFQIE